MAASLSFDSAYRQVRRGHLAPVYYLTGDEEVLKDELLSLLVEHALDPAAKDFNLDVRSAGDLDGESLHTLVETPPLLAERRVVVVKNLEQWRRNAPVWRVLERYVADPSPTTVLALVHGPGQKPHGQLTRHAAHVAVEPLDPARLARWVARRAKRAGVELEQPAVAHLVDAVGGELAQLAMEIEKLAAVATGPQVSAGQVAELVGVRRGETPHDWVTAVLNREPVRAAQMLAHVLALAGMSGVRLVGLLGTALVGVRLARAELEGGAAPRQAERAVFAHLRQARPMGLGNWKDEAAAWVRAARLWSDLELDRAIRAAFATDRALKSPTISGQPGTLTDLVLAIAPERAAA